MRFQTTSAALASLLLLLLPSCVGAPERPHSPAPAPTRRPPPATAPAPEPEPQPLEWQDRPATPGNWIYRAEGTGSVATFAAPGSGPQLTVRCDPAAGHVSFARTGAGQGLLTVRTSYGTVNWPMAADRSGHWIATRAANDAALDQITYSRGHFSVDTPGQQSLILPAWAEVGRVIEDCRH